MLLTKQVTMNLNYRQIPIVMDVMQGDSGRAIEIHFLAGDIPWEIPEDADVIIQYQCEDGSGGAYDTLPDGQPAYERTDGALTVQLIPQLCAVAGHTKLQITLISNGVQITTFSMDIRVSPQVNTKISGGDYTNLAQWWLHMDSKGDTGDSGVYIGTQEPEDPAVRVWIQPDGQAYTPNFDTAFLLDRSTGTSYALYVENGKLRMEELA